MEGELLPNIKPFNPNKRAITSDVTTEVELIIPSPNNVTALHVPTPNPIRQPSNPILSDNIPTIPVGRRLEVQKTIPKIYTELPGGIRLYLVRGIIKKNQHIKSENGDLNLLTVYCVTDGKDYRLQCPYFCPARRGDVIDGKCIDSESGNGQLVLIQEPVVETPTSKEAIMTTFTIYLKKTKFKQQAAERLYRFFEERAIKTIDEVKRYSPEDEEGPIARNKVNIESAVLETVSLYARRFKENEDVGKPLLELGLTKEQIEKLFYGWYKTVSVRRLWLLGLTDKEIRESCERGWTADTLYYQLLENPYIPEKVPMEKADIIARKYNLNFDQNMIESAHLVRHADEQSEKQKWACHPLYGLMRKYPRFNELKPTLVKYFGCRIRYNSFYLRHQARVEDTLAQLLKVEKVAETHCSERTQSTLCPEQIQGVEKALNYSCSIITGGAGVGKTTTIAAICEELEIRNLDYLVTSFTGKAVSRLKKSVRRIDKVITLHMILSRGNLPEITTLIVDEISMVPNELICRVLLKVLGAFSPDRIDEIRNNRTDPLQIVLVGDDNQLQPIQWGDFFNQVLAAEIIPKTVLTIDHRRKTKGVLYSNMNQFQMAENPADIRLEWGEDFCFIQGGIPHIEALVRKLTHEGVDHQQITIICPFGDQLHFMNIRCQVIVLDEDVPQINDEFGKTWKKGARVMMTENRYDIEVMNGDEGLVEDINSHGHRVTVRFDDNQVHLPTFAPVIIGEEKSYCKDQPLSTRPLELSWAVTVHKSQGSEWEHVIFFMPDKRGPSGFLNRNLTYTGISRARTCLYVVGSSIEQFIGTIYVDPPYRYDNLAKRLNGEPQFDYFVDPANTH